MQQQKKTGRDGREILSTKRSGAGSAEAGQNGFGNNVPIDPDIDPDSREIDRVEGHPS